MADDARIEVDVRGVEAVTRLVDATARLLDALGRVYCSSCGLALGALQENLAAIRDRECTYCPQAAARMAALRLVVEEWTD
jgi:hypothetical protein